LAREYCYSLGIEELDELVGCIRGGSIVEFFGELELLAKLSYAVVARWSCYGRVALLVAQNAPLFYNFYEIKKRALLESCAGKVLVSRSFRVEDTIELLAEADGNLASGYVLFDPFAHAADLKFDERWKMAGIVRHLRRLSAHGARVAIFNRSSALSPRAQEGGPLYRHTVHISVRVERVGKRGARAHLLKHPSKGEESVAFSLEDVEGRSKWVGQLRLSGWF